jgi:glycosyltransferase involved in cell wall biosynthesis
MSRPPSSRATPTVVWSRPSQAIDGRPHILHISPGFGVGGAEARTCRLINHFAHRFRHTILSLSGDLACAARLEKDLPVALEPGGARAPNPLHRARDISRALARHAPDLLITYNWGAIEWAAVNRLRNHLPHIHIEDGFGSDEARRRKLRRAWFRRFALARCDALIVPSQTLRDIATREWRVPEARLKFIPNGVDLTRFQPVRRDDCVDVTIIGTLAALRPEKNIARLLRAFAALHDSPPVRLLIAGEGEERSALEALAESLGIKDRVRFLGFSSDASRFLRGLDIFALTSDTEQLPTTVIEAMASGLPVAGVAVGDLQHMVCEINRPLIVPRDDGAGLTAALRRLVSEPALRRVIGEGNRQQAIIRFGEAGMFHAHERLYRSTCRSLERRTGE